MESYFPFSDYWWFYAGFTAFVLVLLSLDLGVFHRKAHAVSFREATVWSIVWIGLALIFNCGFYLYARGKFGDEHGLRLGLEFLTGYVVEKSLSVDNIFVFVLVFSFFAIPPEYQHRVLYFGILGALAFRLVFIVLGSILLQYQWIVVIFGVFLVVTGLKMMLVPEKPVDPERNIVIRGLRRLLPVTSAIHGDHLFVKKGGVLHGTPLLVALCFIEVSDIIFAVDSVPAIFALTKEPLIVYTSNVFAILGLRSLYFLLAGIVHRFVYLKYGLALVLVFVGLKMAWLNEAFGGKFPISWSLAIIGSVIAVSVAASLLLAPKGAHQHGGGGTSDGPVQGGDGSV